jgi:hypothetical protein
MQELLNGKRTLPLVWCIALELGRPRKTMACPTAKKNPSAATNKRRIGKRQQLLMAAPASTLFIIATLLSPVSCSRGQV